MTTSSITDIKISNYKAIKHLEINKCSNVTIIGGLNNVGKTSILEAIFLLQDKANSKAFIRPVGWRGVQNWGAKQDEFFDFIFHNFDSSESIVVYTRRGRDEEELEMNFVSNYQDYLEYDVLNNFANIDVNSPPQDQYGLEIIYRELGRQVRNVVRVPSMEWATKQHLGKPRETVYLGLRTNTPEEDAGRFAALDVENRSDEVLEFVRKFFPSVKSISAVPMGGGSLLYANVGLQRKVPVPLLGDGASRVVSLALALATARNGMVLIDEFGVGVHYSLLPVLWEALLSASYEFGVQIFATTHSKEVLLAASTASRSSLKSELCYFRVEREHASPDLSAVRYNGDELEVAAEHGWEVR